MTLPSELVAEFAKITNDGKDSKKEVTVYGTISVQNGVNYVKLDGSEELTPVVSTVTIADGDRVIVTLKQHTAVVTSNLTDPAASSLMVGNMGVKVTEQGITIGQHDEQLEGMGATITQQGIAIGKHDGSISAINGDISTIHEALDGMGVTISDDKVVIGDHGKLKEIIDAIGSNSDDILGISKKITDEIDVHISGLTAFTNGLKDGTTTINGGCIDTDTLKLSGLIVFGDLDAEMQSLINTIKSTANTAKSDAAAAQTTASSAVSKINSALYDISALESALAQRITSGQASTLITSTLVSSPIIQGGRVSGSVFSNLDVTTWIEVGKDAAGIDNDQWGLGVFGGNTWWGSNTEMIFGVYNGDGEYTSFTGKSGYTFMTSIGASNKMQLYGTWDFSGATVEGVSGSGGTSTAVFA